MDSNREGGEERKREAPMATLGDSKANRQDATQSHKRFHVSDTHRGHGGVCTVCLDRTQKHSVGRVTD